jgi:DNA-directed RNA polymerase subunit RPC12/RpoP
MKHNAVCEICQQTYAMVDEETIFWPMEGSMFLSADPDHDLPPPWPDEFSWLEMKCPYCQFRPFLGIKEITTEKGKMKLKQKPVVEEVPVDVEPAVESELEPEADTKGPDIFTCAACGKDFDSSRKLRMHRLGAHRKR